jgi:imidazolonepropionase-like amidohydrolase
MGYLPPFPTLAEPTQAEAFIDTRLREGSDYIKILIDDGSTTGTPLPKLSEETITALVDHAHARNRLTIAHTLNAADAATAARAGIDVLGHLFVDQLDPDLPHLLTEQDTAVIPTLAVLDGLFGRPHGAELLADHRIEPFLDTTSRQLLGFGPIPLAPEARHNLDVPRHTLNQLRDAGVTILAGSDASNPDTAHGATLHLELELLVNAGLTPIAALTAATSAPADRFTLHDRGRIAPGLRADLLLVDGDPTSNITNTRDITTIWRNGQRIERAAQLRPADNRDR